MAYLFVILMAIVSLVACNQQKEEVKKSNMTEQKNVQKPSNTNGEKNENEKSKDDETTNQNDLSPNVKEKKVYHNDVFKDVTVNELGDKIIVTGKAQVFEGVFQYALYDGEKKLLEKNYQTAGAPSWGDFEITFNNELITTTKTKMELFVYSAKDGSKVNTLDIPIQKR